MDFYNNDLLTKSVTSTIWANNVTVSSLNVEAHEQY